MLAMIRFAAVLMIAIVFSGTAFGQARGHGAAPSQVPRYTPQSPTVSPYLNLFNRNGGDAISNYYGLVRPLDRQQRFNESQSQTVANQGQQLEQQINGVRDEQQAFSQ